MWVYLLTKTWFIPSMFVSSYLVYTCHQNHIFSHHTQPYKNLIFRPNSSRFQNFGRPAQGGQSTDVHKRAQFWVGGRPVHRPVDRSRKPKLRPCIGRPEVDRSLDRLCMSVDRQSTGTRPTKPGAHGLVSVDRPLTPVDRWSVLGRKSAFSVENPNSLETRFSRLTLVLSRLETLSRLHPSTLVD